MINYQILKTPQGIDGKQKEYPSFVAHSVVGENELFSDGISGCTLTRPDMKAALSVISAFISTQIKNGQRVHIPGIGYFEPSLKTTKTSDKKARLAPHNIQISKIHYQPDAKLLKTTRFEAEFSQVKSQGSHKMTESEFTQFLNNWFTNHSEITIAQLQGALSWHRTYAGMWLRHFAEIGKLNVKRYGTQKVFVKPTIHNSN